MVKWVSLILNNYVLVAARKRQMLNLDNVVRIIFKVSQRILNLYLVVLSAD